MTSANNVHRKAAAPNPLYSPGGEKPSGSNFIRDINRPRCGGEAPYQFERIGYFCADPDSKPGKPLFNRTVALKDTWARIEKGQLAS